MVVLGHVALISVYIQTHSKLSLDTGAHITFDLFYLLRPCTFLHTHSWLNWVDEDDYEVGLK